MGKIAERLSEIARRCGDLSPLAQPIRDRFETGNRVAVLAGRDADGSVTAPLRPSTLKRRAGDGPPRAPRGASSRVITGYVVSVIAGPGRLSVTGSWPGFPQARYLNDGTPRMAARPMGWRREDREWAAGQMSGYVVGRGLWPFGRGR